MAASEACCCGCVLLLPEWGCMSYDCLGLLFIQASKSCGCEFAVLYVQRFFADLFQFPFFTDLSLTNMIQICSDKTGLG